MCVCVCVCACVCVRVCKRERESARARVEERARDKQRGWGEVGGAGGRERSSVCSSVCERESVACTSVSEWKRENVSMFESERESVCVKA